MSAKLIILLPNSARCFSLGAAIIAFLIFSFTALPTAKAQSNRFEAGVAAKERGQYLTAIRSWLPLAEDGIPDAQVNLGHMYNEGFGVDRDLSTALYWYERAAESGLGEAKYNLGLLYFDGDGVPKDLVTAITLFREAEEQNIQEASYMLGVAALSGDGVPIDKTEARERFERAALAGIPEAQLAYASVAQSGEGGEPDSSGFFGLFGSNKPPEGSPVVAYVWARLAQINGLTVPELTQVLEIAEIMLTTSQEEAEGIITTCLASELSNCPTAD